LIQIILAQGRSMAETDQDQLFGTTVGERLRVAREEKGMSLDDVARQTRIPIRHLEYIERGEWDALPAITYSVGFARSYANVVGLNGAEIGAELRAQLGGTPRGQAVPASYYEPADPARVPPRWLAGIAVLIIILLVGSYLFWRSRAVDDNALDETAIVETQAPQGPAQRPAAPPPAPSATGPVVVTATDEAWVRIYEPDGTEHFKGTLHAGQRFEVPAGAPAPMIRTGRPNAIQVSVGGTAIPPLGAPEQTIDKVSLKPADLIARLQGAARPGFGSTPIPAPPPTNAPAR
jgi:cytoskeleton protein RodZ